MGTPRLQGYIYFYFYYHHTLPPPFSLLCLVFLAPPPLLTVLPYFSIYFLSFHFSLPLHLSTSFPVKNYVWKTTWCCSSSYCSLYPGKMEESLAMMSSNLSTAGTTPSVLKSEELDTMRKNLKGMSSWEAPVETMKVAISKHRTLAAITIVLSVFDSRISALGVRHVRWANYLGNVRLKCIVPDLQIEARQTKHKLITSVFYIYLITSVQWFCPFRSRLTRQLQPQ